MGYILPGQIWLANKSDGRRLMYWTTFSVLHNWHNSLQPKSEKKDNTHDEFKSEICE